MRRSFEPFDLISRHHLGFQRVRVAVLSVVVALTVLLPLLNLQRMEGAVPPLTGAPTSLRVGPLELVDPLEVTAAALLTGGSWALVWSVLPGVVLVMGLGRFFCGWACPYLPILAASRGARLLLTRLGVRTFDARLPARSNLVVMLGVLVVGTVLGAQVVPLVYPPAVIGRGVFRFIFYGSMGAGAALVAAAFLFDTVVSRAGFCRSLCPGGAMFSLLATPSPLRVVNERSRCTDCTICDVVCNLGQSPMTNRLDSGCERCGKCIAVCPTRALSWKVSR